MADTIAFRRTGKTCYFGNVHIGALFFAHKRFWVRTDTEAATCLDPAEGNASPLQSSCNFVIDGRPIDDAGKDPTNDFGQPSQYGSTRYGEQVEMVEFVK